MNRNVAQKKFFDSAGNAVLLEVFSPEQVEVSTEDVLWFCRYRISRDDVPLIERQSTAESDALDAFLSVIREVKIVLNEVHYPGSRSGPELIKQRLRNTFKTARALLS